MKRPKNINVKIIHKKKRNNTYKFKKKGKLKFSGFCAA